jgi:diguanylate cyclase (GGDEF)-like protein
VRSHDCVGRYGGEEFLIVLPGCDASQALRTAERIRSEIALCPVDTGSAQLEFTASVGVTIAKPDDTSATEILAVADAALDRAKNSGRNRAIIL